MFLTATELAQLTGRKRRDQQRAWLLEHGYKFELNADERPVVLRSVVEARLGGKLKPTNEPDWGALRGQKAA